MFTVKIDESPFEIEPLAELHGWGERWFCKEKSPLDFALWLSQNAEALKTRVALSGVIVVENAHFTVPDDPDVYASEIPAEGPMGWHADGGIGAGTIKAVVLGQRLGATPRNVPTQVAAAPVIWPVLQMLARDALKNFHLPVEDTPKNRLLAGPFDFLEYDAYRQLAEGGEVVDTARLGAYNTALMQSVQLETQKAAAERLVKVTASATEMIEGSVYTHDWQSYSSGSVLIMDTAIEKVACGRDIVKAARILHARIFRPGKQITGDHLISQLL
ncbi:MAG: hypothetical protein HY817_00110 [Candidatus Abawacabacteria bacterium]|nr:hypothetical protein [Candidatus Abawacabacteria bacterium]